MRLIDGDALVTTLKGLRALTNILSGSREMPHIPFDDMVRMIEKSPTIEPERKTGKWVRALDGNDGHVRCDKCFKIYDWDTQAQYYDFCPNCGARMEEGE